MMSIATVRADSMWSAHCDPQSLRVLTMEKVCGWKWWSYSDDDSPTGRRRFIAQAKFPTKKQRENWSHCDLQESDGTEPLRECGYTYHGAPGVDENHMQFREFVLPKVNSKKMDRALKELGFSSTKATPEQLCIAALRTKGIVAMEVDNSEQYEAALAEAERKNNGAGQ